MTRILVTALMILVIGACAKTQKEVQKPETAAQPAAAPAKTAAPMKNTGIKEPVGQATTKCVSGEDVRTLAIVSKGKGCEVSYTKFGNSSVVATSMNGLDHCEDVAGRIQKKLEGAGYTCK